MIDGKMQDDASWKQCKVMVDLARLIARFYEFQDGEIRIDGRDIRSYDLTAYRRQIGMVPQVPFLFSGTLLDNIRYGVPDASEDEVIEAAQRIRTYLAGL